MPKQLLFKDQTLSRISGLQKHEFHRTHQIQGVSGLTEQNLNFGNVGMRLSV